MPEEEYLGPEGGRDKEVAEKLCKIYVTSISHKSLRRVAFLLTVYLDNVL